MKVIGLTGAKDCKLSEISDQIDTLQQDIINLKKNKEEYNKHLEHIQRKLTEYELEMRTMQK